VSQPPAIETVYWRYGNDSSENGPHPQKYSFLRCKIHRFSCLLSLYLPGNHTPKLLKSFRCHHEVAKFLVNRCHTSSSLAPKISRLLLGRCAL
jgi:hypothetical protein